MPEETTPRVFLSYSHDSLDHQHRVLELADRLRADGIDAILDQYEMLPPEGWPAWCAKEIQKAEFVLMVCTETYYRRVNLDEDPGKGHGVLWEGRLIKQQLYDSGSASGKFIPLLFENSILEHIPEPVRGVSYFRVDPSEEYEALYRLLTKQPAVRKPILGNLRRMPERSRRSRAEAPGNETGPQERIAERPAQHRTTTVSNIPIGVPLHFLGRDDVLADMDVILRRHEGRVAITALHGLRGVGKTVLAAAYAEHHSGEYRVTWWIRSETEPTMRADLAALAVRLGWAARDDKEELALTIVLQRLRHEGDGILLVFDSAPDADAIRPYLPRGGATRIIITSNAPAWRGVAEPVEIQVWPKEIGADYLVRRIGWSGERYAAQELSLALGGLPLAHEQAAAYCERLDIPLREYRQRFENAPARMLDTEKDAPHDYHDRRTVAKTFALAIDEAAKLHPAGEALILHAALLAPEPIPLYLFTEAREKFAEPLASALAGDGLDEAIAVLRTFALINRETITDERDPAITTDAIRLHRLVREVAAARKTQDEREAPRRALINAIAEIYPQNVEEHPETWPQAMLLNALAADLVHADRALPAGAELSASAVMDGSGRYDYAIGDYTRARPFLEHALAIREKLLGSDDPRTAHSINYLALLLGHRGEFREAQPLCERALIIREKLLGPEHPDTARSLNNLAALLQQQGKPAEARPLYERALAIHEKALGPEHPDTATSLNNLAAMLQQQGKPAEARPLFERALVTREKVLGPEHPDTAMSLNNLAELLQDQGKLAEARPLLERALAIHEKALGPEHPDTAMNLNNLAGLLRQQGKPAEAHPLFERALAIREKVLGPEHPDTAMSLNNLAGWLQRERKLAEARPLFERALAIREKALGPEHPDTAMSLNNLAILRMALGNVRGARLLMQRAAAISTKALGPKHPTTVGMRKNLAGMTSHHRRR